jgi:hypothetical protein
MQEGRSARGAVTTTGSDSARKPSGSSRIPRWRVVSVASAAALLLVGLTYVTLIAPRLWQSYTDPSTGFAFRYPPGWLLTTATGDTDPTLVNPASHATISVYGVTTSGTPQVVLGSAVPGDATGLQQRRVAGDAAIDFVLPGSQAGGSGDTDPGLLLRMHLVVVAVDNTAGTTNEYTLAMTQPPTSLAASGDSTFEQIVSTFSPAPPVPWLPVLGASGVPRPIEIPFSKSCNAVCWANANWDVNDYTADADGQECTSVDQNSGNYLGCSSETLATLGDFQPDYQCSEFVARALAQEGLVPGLASGGYRGVSSAASNTTSEFGTYSYNSYPFTSAGDAAGGDTFYNLLGVGIPGAAGLYDYLVNSGIGVSLHQSLAEAQPGDVVFFYTSSIQDANREHVMLITSVLHYPSSTNGFDGWDALLDGHNRAAYHSLLSTLTSSDYPFEIIHLAARRGITTNLSTSGSGWQTASDGNGEPLDFVATTSADTPSAGAEARLSTAGACELVVYVPDQDATASTSFQITLAGGATQTVMVDESAVDGWVLLTTRQPPPTDSPPVGLMVGNDTGTGTDTLGLGPVVALCA